MFGFILPNLESLEEAEQKRYRAVYCGVCRSIKNRYGQLLRVTISFDMTFLTLVLGSLYEPKEISGAKRCPVHPTTPQTFSMSEYSDYAADLSVAFAYHKLLDDWQDDRMIRSRAAAFALSGAYRKAKKRIPHACDCIEATMRDIQNMEYEIKHSSNQSDIPFDAPANCFGMLLGELFAYKNDFWATDLRRFGARLGKFVYVMDAAMDLEEDLRTGSYNPFKYMEHDTQALRDNLEYLAASMTDAFERLPLERDMQVMRSVLYAGVWQRFEAKEKKDHDG